MLSNLAHDENPPLIPNMLHQRKHLIKLSFLFGKRKATYTMKLQQALNIYFVQKYIPSNFRREREATVC